MRRLIGEGGNDGVKLGAAKAALDFMFRGAAVANPLYDRESQIADVHRQIAMRQALAENTALGQARRQSVKSQLGMAVQQEDQLGMKFEAAQK